MYDVTIIGGGIVGLATGYGLLKRNPGLKIVILEKESKVGQHQTGHNSGVIHSGIYYRPGSLKALNCRQGINLLLEFCNQNDISFEMCGKVIVATSEDELNTLDLLCERGQGNGIKGIKKLSQDELREYEPHAAGISALYCPETGIINYSQVCEKLSESIQQRCEILTDITIASIDDRSDGITVTTEAINFKTSFLINCAGLFSDRVAELAGVKRQMRIVPFRGEYYMLKDQA